MTYLLHFSQKDIFMSRYINLL